MTIPSAQAAVPPMLEQWDMGIPDRIVEADDAVVAVGGAVAGVAGGPRPASEARRTHQSGRGAEATLTFTGTGGDDHGPSTRPTAGAPE